MGQLGVTPPPSPTEDRLESWKEIAAYLKKSVRTVQEWEKKEGLPVHRRLHDKLGTVYAYRAELDAWWHNGHARLAPKELAKGALLRRLVLCGLLAGFTSNVLQFTVNRLFLAREWRAVMEGLGLETGFGTGIRLVLFALILIGGILALWLYTILRPRFGSGPKTAALAGSAFWLLSWALPALIWSLSMSRALPIPPALLATHLGVHLLINMLATCAGAWALEEKAGEKGKRWTVAGVLAAALLVVAAGVAWWPRTPVLPFAERDWVLIAQFENQTGEEVFNGTLEHALERELSNSRFVNVVPRERVNDSLLLMRKPLHTPLSAAVGREVALRDGGIRALLTGRVEKLDSTYLLSVALVNPSSGVTVRSFSEEAAGQKQVVPTLRSLSGQVRAALGEALPEIQKSDQALEKVTTPSLRALQLFSHADHVLSEPVPYGSEDDEARRQTAKLRQGEELLRQAIAEDPEFASAYVHVAATIKGQQRPQQEWGPPAERATELSPKVSERERYFILGSYYQLKGESEKAVSQFQTLLRLYPDHYWGTNNLAEEYRRLGRREEALPYLMRRADMRPNDFFANATAHWELFHNTDDSAQTKRYHLRALALVTPETIQRFQSMSAVVETRPAYEHLEKGEMDKVLEEVTRLEKRIGGAANAYYLAEMGKAYLGTGKLNKAEELFARIVRDSDRYYFTAWVDYARGDWKAVRRHLTLTAERTVFGPRDVELFVRAGLFTEARRAIADMEARKEPEAYVALARGYLAEQEGKTGEAVQLFEKAREWKPSLRRAPTPIRASAALARIREEQGNLGQAIELLEWARGHRARAGVSLDWMESQMQLARLYRKAGRQREAEEIEDELRKLLVYADADHVIARQLRQPHQAALTPPTK